VNAFAKNLVQQEQECNLVLSCLFHGISLTNEQPRKHSRQASANLLDLRRKNISKL
jgi:hypothetical protein